ncbi:MAG: hypothetical protein DRR16_30755, partial [Candidatus Parabeggiatoa sp. nov. 3]
NLTQINDTILTYGTGNRLLKQGEIEYIYDDNGRLIKKIENTEPPKIWQYTWDGNDYLSSITTPSGEKWTYKYDALGRRILKQGPDKTVRFIWNGNVIIHILENDKLHSTWIHQPRTFKPLCTIQNDQVYSVILDHLGTPQELIDSKGKVVWLAHYQTWGKVESIDTAQKEVDCPIRFPGQWFDEESGLHYNRFRYYDPQTGRFISPDPIGYKGGLNTYWYANNPVNWMDILGLQKLPCSIFNFSLESKLRATLENGSPECQKNMQEELQQILGIPRGLWNAAYREGEGLFEFGGDISDLNYWYLDPNAAIEVVDKYFKAGGAIVDDPSIILEGIFGPTLDAWNRGEYGEAVGEFAALLVFGILDPLKGGGKAGRVGGSINRMVPDDVNVPGGSGGKGGGGNSVTGKTNVGNFVQELNASVEQRAYDIVEKNERREISNAQLSGLAATSRSGVEEFDFKSRHFENLGGPNQFKKSKQTPGVTKHSDMSTYSITNKDEYIQHVSKLYKGNDNRLNPYTQKWIEDHIKRQGNVAFSNKDGFPGLHAEVQAVNDAFNFVTIDKHIDLDSYDKKNIKVSTYKVSYDNYDTQKKPFEACSNCSGILSEVDIITGKTKEKTQ